MRCFARKQTIDGKGLSPLVKKLKRVEPGLIKQGIMEEKSVDKIVLDTGCSRTLVQKDLVPKGKFKEGEAVAIQCAYGDTVLML